MMKFVCACVIDQTVGYFDGEGATTKHPDAKLFDSLDEAARVVADDNGWWIIEVEDEQEFRARPDTW